MKEFIQISNFNKGGAAQYRVAPKVCPIQDDEDGHLSYKLGDIIENETHRCNLDFGDHKFVHPNFR